MRSLALVLAVGLFACSGDQPKPPDGGFKCSGAVYDLCNTEHDCTSMACQLFTPDNFQVCTQPCSSTVPCPNDKAGNPGTCTAQLICKPAAPNSCHL